MDADATLWTIEPLDDNMLVNAYATMAALLQVLAGRRLNAASKYDCLPSDSWR